MRQCRLDANQVPPQLLNLKMGPGAAILPPEVSQIHMDFAMRTHNGHMGAKYVPMCGEHARRPLAVEAGVSR